MFLRCQSFSSSVHEILIKKYMYIYNVEHTNIKRIKNKVHPDRATKVN